MRIILYYFMNFNTILEVKVVIDKAWKNTAYYLYQLQRGMKMQTEPTEAERKEISDCLATVADRFKLYFEKVGIAYLSSGYLEKLPRQ